MRRRFTVSRDADALAHTDEHRKLLRDLHDSIGPTLAATALGVRAVRSLLRSDRAAAERVLNRLEGELHSAIAEIRRLASGMHPAVLDRLGLVEAVRRHAEIIGSRSATAGGPLLVEVDVQGEVPPLPAAIELAAYRIVCEALTNVARHSNAHRCAVRIWLDGDLHVEIVDDGNGAMNEPDVADLSSGVGLRSMRERACSLGGRWAIEAVTPGGTRVAATLPTGIG